MVVAGLGVEGFYGLLRGVIAHPSVPSASSPPKKACHIPSATVSHPPPQEPTCVTPEASKPAAKIVEQASEAASPASEEALPTNMHPLHIQLEVIKRVYRAGLKVAQRDHQHCMLPSAHMCAECIWGWGWCVPPVVNLS